MGGGDPCWADGLDRVVFLFSFFALFHFAIPLFYISNHITFYSVHIIFQQQKHWRQQQVQNKRRKKKQESNKVWVPDDIRTQKGPDEKAKSLGCRCFVYEHSSIHKLSNKICTSGNKHNKTSSPLHCQAPSILLLSPCPGVKTHHTQFHRLKVFW